MNIIIIIITTIIISIISLSLIILVIIISVLHPPIKFNGHDNSHPLELRVCLSQIPGSAMRIALVGPGSVGFGI